MNANYVIEPDPAIELDHEQIARDAYELFCDRGRIDGFDLEDWLQAEHRLKLAQTHRAIPKTPVLPSQRTPKALLASAS